MKFSFEVRTRDGKTRSPIFKKHNLFILACCASMVLFTTLIFLQPANSFAQKPSTVKKDPEIEQQIDIQDSTLSTTSTTYTDASGSGYFVWNSSRYSGLAHVYFEAGIAKNSAISSTKRIRSVDILANLVSGTTYKVRIEYGCVYNSTSNTFTETGYAELWSSDNTTEVTASAVSNKINSGTGTCPANPTVVGVRFSRLIILQSAPNTITDTDTSINIGHTETLTFTDTNDHPLQYPKIWLFTDHNLHPSAGWDSILDILFSATIASPKGNSVSACLYDITSNSQITCVSTSNTTPTYVTSGDVTSLLTDGDQYETYVNTSTPSKQVTLYNSFVTVEQSNSSGLSYFELYNDYNAYPVNSTTASYSQHYFMNDWEPANFNLNTALDIPSTNEVLAFHVETTEQTTASTGSTTLFAGCIPGARCSNSPVYASNMDTANTAFTRVRTPDGAFGMWSNIELDSAFDISGTGNITSTVTWLIINVNIIATYAVQETQNLTYGPNALETYNLCQPVNAPPNRPGLILVHGGSWIGGDKDKGQFENVCNAYAAQGYVVYNVDYRLANVKTGGNQWPDQIGDIQLAVRFMRANAAQTGLDPTRICSFGSSSGSQLALLPDELQTIHPADVASIDANYSPTTQCAVTYYGPSDLTLLYNESTTTQQDLYALLDNQTPTSDPAIYQDASPVDNIVPQTGPVFFCQGTEDTLVPPDQGQELQQDLQSANIPYDYLQYVGSHGFVGLTQGQANMIQEQTNAFLVAQEHP